MIRKCLGECWEIDPPPDSILWLPPPPIPQIYGRDIVEVGDDSNVIASIPCESELCNYLADFTHSLVDPKNFDLNSRVMADNLRADTVFGVEASTTLIYSILGHYLLLLETNWVLSQSSSGSSDSIWLLVLVLAAIFAVIIASLLAMFLLKFKEQNSTTFSTSQQAAQVTKSWQNSQSNPVIKDDRYLWTSVTPKGKMEHYVTCRPQLMDTYENTYEQVFDRNYPLQGSLSKKSFGDYSYYEDPTPLMESYQLSNMENRDVTPPQSMLSHQQLAGGYYRGEYFSRPRVSTPTRIEHPNIPPLNLYPTNRLSNLRRQF